jgi:hypothetical protein
MLAKLSQFWDFVAGAKARRAFRLEISPIRVHSWSMNSFSPADELATIRNFLHRIETGELTLRRGNQDVSQHETNILKREIARLEEVLERIRLEDDKPLNYSGRTKRFSRKR